MMASLSVTDNSKQRPAPRRRLASLVTAVAVLFLTAPFAAQKAAAQENADQVTLQTSMGDIVIKLYWEDAPKSAENFLNYVRAGFYDGTIFHRVIPGFVVQGGGLTPDMQPKRTSAPIANEADNGKKNLRHTLSMARLPDPHSATSQFFINLVDNANLDHRAKNDAGWGYAVFGEVVEGGEVVDAMAAAPTGSVGPYRDVPQTPIVINKAQAAAP